MRLLILSHSCVTPTNQAFFAEVERQTGWDLSIIAPASWRGEYGQVQLERWPDYSGELLGIPVLLSGNIPLHVYRTFFVSQLQRIDPDVVYAHHEPYAAATAQLYLANKLSIQKPIGFFSWQNIRKTYPFPFQQTERMVFRSSSFACPGSESAAEVLRSKGYEGPITRMPAGIDADQYTPMDGTEIRRKFDVADGEVLIGYLGRIEAEKGLGTLLHALASIDDLSWKMAVVGEGGFAQEVDRMALHFNISERVRRHPYVPHTEAPRYLSAFDILVLPSETQDNWKEQFGRVIIEAMACGTPVVGSDSGEIPHLIRRTGGGLIFPERSSSELARCLATLIRDAGRRETLAEAGRTHVLQNYTDRHLATRFSAAIARAAGKEAPRTPTHARQSG